jgi:RNA polymerase sigma-70 factor (ECF subfamily)
MDETERARLVQKAVGGDGDALQRLVVHYHGPLYAIVDARMERALRRHVDPDDILQQAYISAFESIADAAFDGPAGFYRWLERIVLDRLKKTQRDLRRDKRDIGRQLSGAHRATTSHPDLVGRLTSGGSTPSQQVSKREASAAVMSSLARLTEEQRQVVQMRFLEDRPVAEIATRLGKSPAAIHMLTYRGLKTLRKLMVSISRYLSRH